ncbi:MAG: trypsin-like peptidase domain-containing protein [Clostridia bacterium]|nr:trypsin-like peptidase domain-containing protein [Clostridia bacterium]
MANFNEFDWNETIEPEVKETKPLYTENIRYKTRKRKNPFMMALIGALVGGIVASGATVLCVPYVRMLGGNVVIYRGASQQQNEAQTQALSVTGEEKTELTIAEVAKRVGPAVVGISCNVTTTTWFGTQQGTSGGSGIILNNDGYIVTNNHVVNGGTNIKVKFNNGDEVDATIVGADSKTDIAVIKVEANPNYNVAILGDSDTVQVGETAIAIGNPLADELFGTVTAGVISGVNRTVKVDDREMTLLQTDAAINSGNSGGALVNLYGEIIGINSVKIVSTTTEGIGFAIPINEVVPIVQDLIEYGYVKGRPLVGISVREITKELAYYNDLPVDHGLYVMGVTENSGAEKAGIKRGDIVLKFDGVEVTTSAELNAQRDKHAAGDVVQIEIDRDGQTMVLDLTLTEDRQSSQQ